MRGVLLVVIAVLYHLWPAVTEQGRVASSHTDNEPHHAEHCQNCCTYYVHTIPPLPSRAKFEPREVRLVWCRLPLPPEGFLDDFLPVFCRLEKGFTILVLS